MHLTKITVAGIGSGENLRKLHRASIKTDLRLAKVLDHLEIDDVTESDIDDALDEA